MLRHLFHDLRHGVRVLAAKPGFALAVVLTLALGIGANTAIFSVINGLLLKPLPYADSAQLVYIYNSYSKMSQETSGMTVPDYLDRREQANALADSALYYDRSFNLANRTERNTWSASWRRRLCSRRSRCMRHSDARSRQMKPSSVASTSPCSAMPCGRISSTPMPQSSVATSA